MKRWNSAVASLINELTKGSAREPDALDIATIKLHEILLKYQEPTRHYHKLAHLVEMFEYTDALSALSKNPTPITLVFATFFHDLIYDGKEKNNEELSADEFLDFFEGERTRTSLDEDDCLHYF